MSLSHCARCAGALSKEIQTIPQQILTSCKSIMWFINLALLVLKLSVSAEGFSTCQSYNLDDHKSKRIEAVRGQILSKLRIRSPPDPDASPSPESVPPEVMLLYNSTKELLKERARQAEAACDRESSEEDYYAKEVQRVNMIPQRTETSECLRFY